MAIRPDAEPASFPPHAEPASFPRDLAGSLTSEQSAELKRRQRAKNWVVLGILFAVGILFYAISMVRFKVS